MTKTNEQILKKARKKKQLAKWLNSLIVKHAKASGEEKIPAWVLDNFFWEVIEKFLEEEKK